MTVTTHDNQVLTVLSLGKLVQYIADDGEPDWKAEPCSIVVCRDKEGKKVELAVTEIKHFNKPYTFVADMILFPMEKATITTNSDTPKEWSLDSLLVHCCKVTGVTTEELQAKTKRRTVTAVRGLFCYLACKLTSSKLESIGEKVSLTHDMVIYYRDTVKGYVESKDKQTLRLLEQLDLKSESLLDLIH